MSGDMEKNSVLSPKNVEDTLKTAEINGNYR